MSTSRRGLTQAMLIAAGVSSVGQGEPRMWIPFLAMTRVTDFLIQYAVARQSGRVTRINVHLHRLIRELDKRLAVWQSVRGCKVTTADPPLDTVLHVIEKRRYISRKVYAPEK